MRRGCIGLVVVLAACLLGRAAGGAPPSPIPPPPAPPPAGLPQVVIPPPSPPVIKEIQDAAGKSLSRLLTLQRGAYEIEPDAGNLLALAKVQAMVGLLAEAVKSYQRLLATKPHKVVADMFRNEIKRLKQMPSPFDTVSVPVERATAEARQALAHGRRLARRADPDALNRSIRYFRAALVLDPELPGTYRALVAAHDKLKDPAKKQAFLLEYLRIRPDGRDADEARKQLGPTGELASLTLTASFPCKIWINGRSLGKTTPVRDLLLPPGTHLVSFANINPYHILKNERVVLRKGQRATLDFPFGVLKVKLRPRARVSAAQWHTTPSTSPGLGGWGGGQDLGPWRTLGLPVGKYAIELTAQDNSRRKTLDVVIQAGKTVNISSW
jgi:hypothetical protein